ncbi:SDR family NAD(P)-dependent oxidoreductase [Pseudomonas frederiksbergensis]|nr:SDR family NAD(P)-dependent oxidoreductase [Pseudomonas frederiksbergensis]
MAYDSIYKPDLFAGQTIIVTGGGSGIGRCTAHELAALGALVLLGRAWPMHKAQNRHSYNGFHRAYLPEVLRPEASKPDELKDKE